MINECSTCSCSWISLELDWLKGASVNVALNQSSPFGGAHLGIGDTVFMTMYCFVFSNTHMDIYIYIHIHICMYTLITYVFYIDR